MERLNDDDLAIITGRGFSSFSVTQENGLDIARMNLNIHAATFTEIDSLKMGHSDRGAGAGWDQYWLSTDLGAAGHQLSMSGFFMEARFTDLDDPGSRRLAGITFGYQSVWPAPSPPVCRVSAAPFRASPTNVKTWEKRPSP